MLHKCTVNEKKESHVQYWEVCELIRTAGGWIPGPVCTGTRAVGPGSNKNVEIIYNIIQNGVQDCLFFKQ